MKVERIEAPATCEGSEGLLAVAIYVGDGLRAEPGVKFFTNPGLPLQLASIRHPAGHEVAPHVHRPYQRALIHTGEFLLVRRGILSIEFYTSAGDWVCGRSFGPGDMVLIVAGGHSMRCEQDVELVEVKQGPYAGSRESDKVDLPVPPREDRP